ncbi:MAG: dicarboxylate/amino acid:cation symporter [Muribaculaceae bacterium]|nr:dicarboxylate/amino acid:cation symporter [Muribaculaceae bacterium]
MKLRKPGLLPCIIIAMLLGIAAGFVSPDWLTRIFLTFNAIFSQFLGFVIPVLILALVAPAIADIGNGAGKMLVATALIAYFATVCSGLLSYFTGITLFPSMISPGQLQAVEQAAGEALKPYLTVPMPPLMDVTSALVLSFILGLGASALKTDAMRLWLDDLRSIIMMVIKNAIIPLLPLYIFGIFLNMTVAGQVAVVLVTFAKIIGVIFVLHIGLMVAMYCVAAFFSRHSHNPFRLLWTMMPAYFTALGTQSSAATIPVTLKNSIRTGVNPDVAGFVIPLCATIHLSGSALKIVACAMALMIMQGTTVDFPTILYFISMLAITMVAAPGVPGGAIMAALGVLSSILGFSEADNALMIALYIAMDSFGTACNVTCDGAIALIIDRFFGKKQHSSAVPA